MFECEYNIFAMHKTHISNSEIFVRMMIYRSLILHYSIQTHDVGQSNVILLPITHFFDEFYDKPGYVK